MKETILIATPDQKWTSEASQFLAKEEIHADVASNGKECQLKLYQGEYRVVVLDIETKEHSGIEVLKYIRLNRPFINVVLTLPNKKYLSDLELDELELRRMGVQTILVRPFGFEKLIEGIRPSFGFDSWKDIRPTSGLVRREEITAVDDQFTRVKLTDLGEGCLSIFDMYVRKSTNKYVKVLSKGQIIQHQEITQAVIISDLEYLYFRTSERGTYINYINEKLSHSLRSSGENGEKKFDALKNASEFYIEEIYTSGINANIMEEGKRICDNMYNLLKAEKDLLLNMRPMNEPPNSFAHLFLVSFYATVISKNLDWGSDRTSETVAMAGFLHDIGMLKLDPILRAKRVSDMNADELKAYMEHPRLGEEMLRKYPGVPQAVRQIVYQHHETVNRTGFPNQLSGTNIYPLAKIVSLAIGFTDFLRQNNLSPVKALKEFMNTKSELQKYEPTMLKALVTGFMKK